MSLDGFIARVGGEYDWIIGDEAIDFTALFAEFDTLVMGRRTFEDLNTQGADHPAWAKQVVVASRTLRPADYPDVQIVNTHIAESVAALKQEPGRDIWLFGGGALFRHLLDARLVDTIEVAVMPILLSQGIPVLPAGEVSPALHLAGSRALPSGILMLSYGVGDSAEKPRASKSAD